MANRISDIRTAAPARLERGSDEYLIALAKRIEEGKKNGIPESVVVDQFQAENPGREQGLKPMTFRAQLAPVPIGLGVTYQPRNVAEAVIVNANPVARHTLAGAAAMQSGFAAWSLALQGRFAEASVAQRASWQAMSGVLAPF